MKISDIFKKNNNTISFEFFPPKTSEGEKALLHTISLLKPLNPSFVSITYGAMGTTQEKTFQLAYKIKNEFSVETMAHLTCVNADKDNIKNILLELKNHGIKNILALRGDIPKEEKPDIKKSDFTYASDLVEFIRRTLNEFCIGVAGYPEGHIQSYSKEEDIRHLKIKVDKGADFIITQLFFDNRFFFEFIESARKAGINIPIIPGIMPITNTNQLQIFKDKCGVHMPREITEYLSSHADDLKAIREFGIEYTTKQCEDLQKNGVTRFHFYTLNRSTSTLKICENLSR